MGMVLANSKMYTSFMFINLVLENAQSIGRLRFRRKLLNCGMSGNENTYKAFRFNLRV